jgi:hypothetical protein
VLRDSLVIIPPFLVFVIPMVLHVFWQEEIAPRIRAYKEA